jgi:hyperosmotically inducible protein
MKKQFLFYPLFRIFFKPLLNPAFNPMSGRIWIPAILLGLVLIGCGSEKGASPVFSGTTDPANTPRSFSTRLDDSIISSRVKTRMISDDFVKAGPVNVDVYNGVAYLKGTVETDSLRRMTADLVRGVEGVVRVENQLVVRGNNPFPETDAVHISAKIQMNLLKDPDIGSLPILVETTASEVILKGTVRTQTQKQKAAFIAGNEAGGRRVINQITLKN